MLIMLFNNVYKVNKAIKLKVFLKFIIFAMYKLCIKSYIGVKQAILYKQHFKNTFIYYE